MQPPVHTPPVRVVAPANPPELTVAAARGLLRILRADLARQHAGQGASTIGREDEALAS